MARKMPERWWISVCPGCNGLVWGGTETHNETCTYRGKMFAPRSVEVVPAMSINIPQVRELQSRTPFADDDA